MSPHREDRLAVKNIYAQAAQLEKQDGIKRHVDHIIPISRGGKHVAKNLQILSATENMKKGARMPSFACHGGGDA
jgi:5-methylcytosine-specific restriction endonuclease McrA|tara:strand:+ start:6077 stop:6301 length:225 start_codon:yes stop_codon:yes gene_type:complete